MLYTHAGVANLKGSVNQNQASRLFAVKHNDLFPPNFFSLCPLIFTFVVQQTLIVNHWQEQTGETFSLALEQSTAEVKMFMKVILVVWCHLKSPPSLAVKEMSISPQHFKAATALQLFFIVLCGYIKHSRSLQCEKISSVVLDPNFCHLSLRQADVAVI